jgi:hypothetical protein
VGAAQTGQIQFGCVTTAPFRYTEEEAIGTSHLSSEDFDRMNVLLLNSGTSHAPAYGQCHTGQQQNRRAREQAWFPEGAVVHREDDQ